MTDTIVVLREGVHGMPVSEYAEALEERLPQWRIEVARTPAAERELVGDARVVTGFALEGETLAAADRTELFQGLYAGADHLPLDEMADRGIAVTTASGVHAPNAAEQAVAYLLAVARDLPEGMRRQERREWRHYQTFGELQGSTVTVVGLGSIGRGIVERLDGFGVETIGVRYTPSKGGPTDEVIGFDDDAMQSAFARTDYLVLACPLTDATRDLVDETALATLPPDAVLVNVARGGVVDTDALVAALRGNDLHAAALDVVDPEPLPEDHPLWTLENVLITPHNAGYTPKYYERVADILSENVSILDGDDPDDEIRNRVA